MFEDLKEAIEQNPSDLKPDMANWWALIADIEKAVPSEMLHKGWMGYVKKAARILFYREVCQDDSITSTKDLSPKTLHQIHKWINGENDIEHCFALAQWFNDNQHEIYAYAATDVKPAKLAQDKARREEKKRLKHYHEQQQRNTIEEDDIPF